MSISEDEFGTLPLSRVLEVAILDLKKVRRSKKYVVDFTEWHQPLAARGVCAVCLAGAVMARTLKVPAKTYAGPFSFFAGVRDRLLALNEVRAGFVGSAIRRLHRKVDPLRLSQVVEDLQPTIVKGLELDADDYPEFYRRMSTVVKVLSRYGF